MSPRRLRPLRQRRRARTVPLRLLAKALRAGSTEGLEASPRTRGSCVDGLRPCPWVGCKYHLYLEVMPNGSIKFNFPELEPGDLVETCVLGVVERAEPPILDEIGALMNLTRERVRQIEERALVRANAPMTAAR